MTPFEDLIRELSVYMSVDLHPDSHQSCTISFLPEELSIQVDLDTDADKIIIGTQLGRITPGSYRQRIFIEAMRSNGAAQFPSGILSFSEKNDTLILFQFIDLAYLTGEKCYQFLQQFRHQANLWKESLKTGNIPQLPDSIQGEKMFGLRS